MQRRGTHLFSLPSALRRRSSNSSLNSSRYSASSQSPEVPSRNLPPSSRSSIASLAESSNADHNNDIYQRWSLLSIDRVENSPGMVLVALYHLATATMYTWPLQTDPRASQPKQGTVFIASAYDDEEQIHNEDVTSESLKVLTGVLLTWMRQRDDQSRAKKVKLGEYSEHAEWLRVILKMPRLDDIQRQAILDKQVVRPINEWGSASTSAIHSPCKGKERVLSSLNTNTHRKVSHSPSSSVPSIEITSPTSSDVIASKNALWLKDRKARYVS